jgi:PKD repeat protein
MRDRETRRGRTDRRPWRIFHFDAPLLVFLTLGWLLIFAAATLALQRDSQRWLSVNLGSQVSANYGVDIVEAPRLAPVRPQIVEAVRQDARAIELSTPTVAVAEATLTPTLGPTLTPALTLSPYMLAVSVGGPYRAKEGSPVSLVARVAGSATETLTYRWDLDDDGAYDDAKGVSASVVFYDEGEYTVGVQVADQTGRVAADTATVRVSNVAPMVDVGGDRYTAEGEEIAFLARVSDPGHDVLFYYWDLGDGTQATGTLRPRHTYLDNGDYTVRLRAEDNDGAVTEASFVARVGNLPPVVDAGPDQMTTEGGSVAFSGTASDPGVFDSLSYAWDLNYDGLTFTPDILGPTASAVYSDGPAAVVAALRVEDKDGGKTLDTVNVSVNNVAPAIASVTNDGPVGEGSPMTLVVNATDVGSDTLTYAFDWENDGDFDAVGQPAVVSHVWYNQGTYIVGIGTDDGDGGQAFTTTAVSAYNVAPTAAAGPEVARLEGSLVTFSGSGSSDPGIYDVLTYQWSFGDGSPIASGITATHIYADNNVYSATLTVTDDSGAGDADSVAVTILNANPIADAGLNRTSDEGVQLNLTGAASDPGAADMLTFAWDFDFDGFNFNEDATGVSVNRTYPDGPAGYVVALRVRDDDYPYPPGGGGEIGEAIDTLQVTVNNVPPIAEANGPYTGHTGQSITLSGTGWDVPADVLSYAWDLDSNGTFDLAGQTVITAWNMAGVYTVTLRVTDDDGGAGSDSAQVTVSNTPPTADAGGPYIGDEGSPIVLIGTGFDADGDPLTYIWDLDYDSIFETPGQVVTNTWPDDGVYTITLRVDDGWGGVATDDATVIVNNVPPTADAGGPYTTTVGITVTLVGTGTDVLSDALTYTWDLNDDSFFDDGTGQVVTYVWTTTGIYTVTLQVDDGDGGVTTDATTVNVNSLYPVAWLGVSYFLALSKEVFFLRKRRTRGSSRADHRR